MGLPSFTTKLTVPRTPPLALILDASESALDQWQDIARLAREILELLPHDALQGVWFLGNRTKYLGSNPELDLAQRFSENRLRISLISPILRSMSNPDQNTILVIGNGQIFDIEDWWPYYRQKFVLVNFGSKLAPNCPVRELTAPSAQDLLSLLVDPVISVEIVTQTQAPIRWDNPAYVTTFEGNKFILRAQKSTNLDLMVTWLGPNDPPPTATLTKTSGKQETIQLEQIASENIPLTPQTWDELSQMESELFNNASQKKPYHCPVCGAVHPWDIVRCLESHSILGKIVYPTLDKARCSGFFLFKKEGDTIKVSRQPANLLQVGPDSIALRQQATVSVIKFNEVTKTWSITDMHFEQYTEIEPGVYAIVV